MVDAFLEAKLGNQQYLIMSGLFGSL